MLEARTFDQTQTILGIRVSQIENFFVRKLSSIPYIVYYIYTAIYL